MYDWNLRLSKRKDIWIIGFCWVMTIFYTIANYYIYATASSYDLYQKDTTASTEALLGFLYLGSVAMLISIILLGDRLLASKQAKSQELPSDFTPPSFDFKRRNLIRIILIGIITFLSLPWILALIGIYISDVPGLNLIFLGAQPYHGLPSVHLGRHHGTNAYIFAVYAIVFSMTLDSEYYLKNIYTRSIMAGGIIYLSLYAFIAGVEDGMNEQLVKRGIDTVIYPYIQYAYGFTLIWVIVAVSSLMFMIIWYKMALRKQ